MNTAMAARKVVEVGQLPTGAVFDNEWGRYVLQYKTPGGAFIQPTARKVRVVNTNDIEVINGEERNKTVTFSVPSPGYMVSLATPVDSYRLPTEGGDRS